MIPDDILSFGACESAKLIRFQKAFIYSSQDISFWANHHSVTCCDSLPGYLEFSGPCLGQPWNIRRRCYCYGRQESLAHSNIITNHRT